MTVSPQSNDGKSPAASDRRLTLPNLLAACRLIGSIGLVFIAVAERPTAFLAVYVLLALTDWIDGKLAIWLNQRTTFGARLDSLADATLYGALLIGLTWLRHDALYAERFWLLAALATYAASCLAGLIKFRRLPSYHTRGAKISWFLVFVAVVALLLADATWPIRVAAVAVTLTNLEATALTCVLRKWQADVPSLYHALRRS